MKVNLYFLIGTILFIFSCDVRREDAMGYCPPQVTEARGYHPARTFLAKPRSFPTGNLKPIQAGKSVKIPVHPNQKPVLLPSILVTSPPKWCVPGIEPFQSPVTKLAIKKPVPASNPKIAAALDLPDSKALPDHFSTFGKLKGLADETIWCAYQDRRQRMWFGTRGGGVILYDGKTFYRFTQNEGLGDNEVYSILEDRKGNMWFGTSSGVSRYGTERNGRAGSKRSFIHFSNREGFVRFPIKSILEDHQGHIWFAPENGGVIKYLEADSNNEANRANGIELSRQATDSFIYFKEDQGFTNSIVKDMLEDHSGHLWFATDGGGLIAYGKSEPRDARDSSHLTVNASTGVSGFMHYTESEGLDNNYVNAILEDSDNQLWIGCYGGSVLRFDGSSFFRFTRENGFIPQDVNSIRQDKKGAIWFGSDGGGLFKYDTKAQESRSSLTHYSVRDGLISPFVKIVLEDNKGNLWLGYDKGGLGTYDNKFERIDLDVIADPHDPAILKNTNITCILHDRKGNHWFGTDGAGLIRNRDHTLTRYSRSDGLIGNTITAIIEDRKGAIWIGTREEGVCQFDGSEFIPFHVSEGGEDDEITCMLEDINGNLWFGTRHQGVIRYDGESVLTNLPASSLNKAAAFSRYTTSEGLSSNEILCMLEDKQGNIWFGTRNAGVCKYDGQSYPDGKAGFTRYGAEEGLRGERVVAIVEDMMGQLWFSTWGEGISKFDGRTFTSYTTKQGLPNNFVHSLTKDMSGHLWVGTSEGLSRWAGVPEQTALSISRYAGLFSALPPVPLFLNNTYENKFWEKGTIRNSIQPDKNDFIWIGSGNKLSVIQPVKQTSDKHIPLIRISGIDLFNERMPWTHFQNKKDTAFFLGNGVKIYDFKFQGVSEWFGIPNNLSLTYNNNYLTFHYQAVTPGSSEAIRYQFKLTGYEKEWSAWSGRSEAAFVNLPPLPYTFKVRAINSDGVLSDEYHYHFTIRPPWWQTWWAKSTYLAVFAGLLLMVVFLRTRRLTRQKLLLETRVAERTFQLNNRTKQLQAEKQKSDDLLLNILPVEIADELKKYGKVEAREFEQVSILFGDFKDFTRIAQSMTHKELVAEINECYQQFDLIISRYGIEKIKTIGDSYMAAGGLPHPDPQSATHTILAALEMQEYMFGRKSLRSGLNLPAFDMRVGIHTGRVVAGVVGLKKFQYDIWGDAVNTASRMENTGEVGMVNISFDTYRILKNESQFKFISRGNIEVKGKGKLPMYYVFLAGTDTTRYTKRVHQVFH